VKNFKKTNLFSPFSQENSDLGSKPRGLGLGLALSKKLIEDMNGSFQFNSKKDVGTKISIYLPNKFPNDNEGEDIDENVKSNDKKRYRTSSLITLLENSSIHENLIQSQNNQENFVNNENKQGELSKINKLKSNEYGDTVIVLPNQYKEELKIDENKEILESNQKLKALIIDDNWINRKVLSKMLMNQSFQILEANSGLEGIKILSQNKDKIDVILLVFFFKY